MLVLPLLLIILGIAISLFGQQIISIDALQIQHEAQRAAQEVALTVNGIGLGPPGSEVRVFLPPSLEPQTIIVQNGVVEVRSTRAYASAPVMDTTWLGTGIADGNFFEAGKDEYGYFWMRGSS